MSVGGLVGGIVGGVAGFFISGGNPIGALYGFGVGFAIGMAIDPISHDTNQPSPLAGDLQITTNTIGSPVPDLLGTAKCTGNLLWYGLERNEAVYTKVSSGGKGGGGGSSKQLTGYKYYMSWAVGLCLGEIDTLYTVYRNEDDVVWEGELDRPEAGGEETVVLEMDMGSMTFYFGTDDQVPNVTMGAALDEPTLNTPYRGLCWAYFNDCYIGTYNRMPTMKFSIRKSPTCSFDSGRTYNDIQTYDYNPMHAIWYILHNMAGLPISWMYDADFLSVATTLSGEDRGISVFFDRSQSALQYIEAINSHIDNILRYGIDSKFHPKLIRDDYTVETLPSVDESLILKEPTITRKSWIDTINEIKVQYTELMAEIPVESGEWVAAMTQRSTPCVYVYDLSLKSVMRVVMQVPPLLTGILPLEPDYDLDFSMGGSSAQRGGYCINKSETRLWYLFRTGNDCELVEVNIESGDLRLVRKTVFLSLIGNYGNETIHDGCADDNYTYWCTDLKADGHGRIIKIRNSDHVLVDNHVFDLDLKGYEELIQGITQMDVWEDHLFWNYVVKPDGADTCFVFVRTSTSFTLEIEYFRNNSGLGSAYEQDFVRVYGDYVLQHQDYHPFYGQMWKWDFNLSTIGGVPSVHQNYLQNILGLEEGFLFTLRNRGGLAHVQDLQCIGWKEFNVYSGVVVGDSYNENVSALNNGLIGLFRYNGDEKRNYVRCYTADVDMKLLCDTPMDKLSRYG